MSYWAVAYTESQREQTAKRFLEQAGYETYLPLVAVKKRTIPLFPAYLFVQVVDRWYSISNTIGVVELLLSGDVPAKVPDDVIPAIRRRERDGVVHLPKEPKPRGLQLGDTVRIIRGSFADHYGLYDGQSGKDRVAVLLSLFGRLTRTEIASIDMRRA
jgi:transcriptional antiterminator RfaH